MGFRALVALNAYCFGIVRDQLTTQVLLSFFPVLLIVIFLPRLIGGAIAVAIFQKGNTALYNENMESLAKAATESICAAGPSQWIV